MSQDLAVIDPLVPADCDCTGFSFMPWETMRLRNSDFTALSTGDEFKAAVLLWGMAWHQVPASSVPDDDRILAKYAMLSLADWKAIREMALHGFIKCSDGRLYHPLIADLAMSAYAKRRHQSARANSRWAKEREKQKTTGDAGTIPVAMIGHATGMPTAPKFPAETMQGTVDSGQGRERKKRTPTGVPKAGTRIPEDWKLEVPTIQFARDRGFTDDQIRNMRDRFKNHWLASSSDAAVKVDWDAAWRTWVLKDAESRGPAPNAGRPPQTPGEPLDLDWC